MSRQLETLRTGRGSEAGFTLVEALTAIVILVFGLMAVTNLMLVAASSNTVANQGTAATASASQVMDFLRSTSYSSLTPGGPSGGTPFISPVNAGTAGTACSLATAASYACFDDMPGVGRVVTQWQIVQPTGTSRARFIRVRSEGTATLAGARSRSEFTVIRSCTDSTASPAPTACPLPP
jgi:hypothetical protein